MRPIDADRLKETIKKLDAESPDIKTARIVNRTIQEIFPQIIDDEPTIKAERVYAKMVASNWTIKAPLHFDGKCSRCNSPVFDTDEYCAECGAKLMKEADQPKPQWQDAMMKNFLRKE